MTKLDLYLARRRARRAQPPPPRRRRPHRRPVLMRVVGAPPARPRPGRRQLEQESGFEELFDAIHTTIWDPARRRGLADAGRSWPSSPPTSRCRSRPSRKRRGSAEAARETLARLAECRTASASSAPARRAGSSGWPRACRTPSPTSTTTCAPGCARWRRTAEGTDRQRRPGRRPRVRGVAAQGGDRGRHRPLRVDHRPRHRARRRDRPALRRVRPAGRVQVEAAVPTDLLAAIHVNRRAAV